MPGTLRPQTPSLYLFDPPDGLTNDTHLMQWLTLSRNLILLWLAGASMRLTILAVPPVIAAIQRELTLSATQVGLLNSLPALMFALAALPGSLLVARLGTKRTLCVGLVIVAFGSALRGLNQGAAWLYATTLLMGAGVAIMQPTMPATVRQWLPNRVGFGTAIYTNGLLAGEVFPVVLTLSWVLPAVHSSWRMALVVWSIPVAVVALLMASFAPAAPAPLAAAPRRWLPNWRDGLIWRLAVLFGAINSLYFSANAFIPGYFVSRNEGAWIGPALSALNFGQIPTSFLLLAFAQQLERRAWPYFVVGAGALISLAGIVLGQGLWAVAGAALLGSCAGGGLILALSLPALLSPPEEVARTSAAVFTLSYGSAVLSAIVSGLAWDCSGIPALAFAPLALCALALSGIGWMFVRRGELR